MMVHLCNFLEAYENSDESFNSYFSRHFSTFHDRSLVVKILNMEYEPNNISDSRAIRWLSSFFDVFDEELISYSKVFEDLGEAMYNFSFGNDKTSNLTIKQLDNLLSLDCSKRESNNAQILKEEILKMSRIELKWFIRLWLRKPRAGVLTSNIRKALIRFYDRDEISEWSKLHSLSYIVRCLEDDVEPEMTLITGQFIKPMLAKPRPGMKKFDDTIVDYKFDGNRYQIHKSRNNVSIFNRKGKRVTDKFPDVLDMASEWPDTSVILDCEFYPVDTTGRPLPHQRMATRVHSKDVQKAIEKCPIEVVAFDILYYKGDNLMGVSQLERKELLSELPYPSCPYYHESLGEFNINAIYNNAIDEGFEGIMLKDASATYDAGKRGNSWWKYKPAQYELDVVITSAKMGKGKNIGLFSTYGVSILDNGNYVNIGYVGNGFSDEDLERLTGRLRKNIESVIDNEYNVLPRIVLTIVFEAVTLTDEGYSIRFPRNKTIRDDKYPADIDKMSDLMEMI